MAIAVGMHVVFLAFDTVIRRPLKLDAVERVNIIYSNAAALVIPLVQALLGSEYVDVYKRQQLGSAYHCRFGAAVGHLFKIQIGTIGKVFFSRHWVSPYLTSSV